MEDARPDTNSSRESSKSPLQAATAGGTAIARGWGLAPVSRPKLPGWPFPIKRRRQSARPITPCLTCHRITPWLCSRSRVAGAGAIRMQKILLCWGLKIEKPSLSAELSGWSFPFLAEAATGTAHTPCLTYNPTKPGWLLATVKSNRLVLFLAAHSWYVLFPCGRTQDARGSINRTHGEA